MNVPYKDMDFELFKRVVARLNGVYEINLSSWGETLLHPRIFEMIKYCKDLGFKTDFTSNGSLLSPSVADKLIKAGLDRISFSIDTLKPGSSWGHNITNQIKNIEDFSKRNKKPKITLQTTIHQDGLGDILEVIKFAKEINAERVNLVRLDIRFDKNLKRPDEKEEKEIVKRAISFGDKIKFRVDFILYSFGGHFQRFFYKIFKNFLHKNGKYCLRIYNYAYINVDGQFTPCTSLPNYKIKHSLDDSLKNIWQGVEMKKFRKKQREICKRCDVLHIKQIN